jgi:hypothetical protein
MSISKARHQLTNATTKPKESKKKSGSTAYGKLIFFPSQIQPEDTQPAPANLK